MIAKTTLIAIAAATATANADEFLYLDVTQPNLLAPFGFFSATTLQAPGGPFAEGIGATVLSQTSTGTTDEFGTVTFSTIQTETLLRLEADWDGLGTAGNSGGDSVARAEFQAAFTLAQDTDVRLSWDLTGTGDSAGGVLLFVQDVLNVGSIISIDAGTSGSFDFQLFGGFEYALSSGILDPIFVANETQFIQFEVIPTPGAAAAFGFAGLFAARRRRA